MELLKILPLGDVDLEEMVDECDKDGDGEVIIIFFFYLIILFINVDWFWRIYDST